MADEKMTPVLRESLRRLVGHLESTALYQDAWDDYHAARMYVGRACDDWDGEAAERAHRSIRDVVGVTSATTPHEQIADALAEEIARIEKSAEDARFGGDHLREYQLSSIARRLRKLVAAEAKSKSEEGT